MITRPCCNDAAFVPASPANCIHRPAGRAGYGTPEMLRIGRLDRVEAITSATGDACFTADLFGRAGDSLMKLGPPADCPGLVSSRPTGSIGYLRWRTATSSS